MIRFSLAIVHKKYMERFIMAKSKRKNVQYCGASIYVNDEKGNWALHTMWGRKLM